MTLEHQLTDALKETYRKAGQETGYWAHRFLQALNRKGGVFTAKRMMRPRTLAQRAGLDRMLDARRPDLTVEAVMLRPEFRKLFNATELETAEGRLAEFRKESTKRGARRERLYPDELEPGRKYLEGARKFVRVNAYERDPRVRAACLKRWGFQCSVCDLLFEKRYGNLGRHFIHVHHIKPLALAGRRYEVDTTKDLRPVCPNCHAMLHRPKKVLTIDKLKALLAKFNSE
jgi:5-methylcytosine-specific restriction protein A